MSKDPLGRGRPTKYKPEYCQIALTMCRLGARQQDVADALQVRRATVQDWIAANPEFAEAMRVGGKEADDRVERSLYETAIGYDIEAEKVFCHQGEIVRATVVEHIPAEHRAAWLWLKNRRRDEWRDTQDVNHTGTLSLTLSQADATL